MSKDSESNDMPRTYLIGVWCAFGVAVAVFAFQIVWDVLGTGSLSPYLGLVIAAGVAISTYLLASHPGRQSFSDERKPATDGE